MKFIKIIFIFLSIFFISSSEVKAYFEDFNSYIDDYDITDLSTWSATGTASGIVSDTAISELVDGKFLYFYTDESTNSYLQHIVNGTYNGATSTISFSINPRCDLVTHNDGEVIIGFNFENGEIAVSDYMFYVTFECSTNNILINAVDTSRDFVPDDWNFINIQYDRLQNKARIKVGNGAWSSLKNTTNRADEIIYGMTLHGGDNDEQLRVGLDQLVIDDTVFSGYVGEGNLDIYNPDFETVLNLNCDLGSECKLWFIYNEKAVGGTLYLLYRDSVLVGQNGLQSYEIDGYYTGEAYFTLPAESSTTTIDYALVLEHPTGRYIKMRPRVSWFDIEAYFDSKFPLVDINNLCDDIATSTGIFDDFRYSIECGGRKLSYWAFTPTNDAREMHDKQINEFNNQFPLSVYNQIKISLDEISTTSDQIIPFTAGTLNFGDYINTNTFRGLGDDLFNKYYELAQIFIYIMLICYFIFRFQRMAQK